jgi:hypothetical protein
MSFDNFFNNPYRGLNLESAKVSKLKLFGVNIQGVEVTQAIQYYRAEAHLSDPADRQPDNAVRLVAHKPAWVRVYVRGSPFIGLPNILNVTGKVKISRLDDYGNYNLISTLDPQPPGAITAKRALNFMIDPSYAVERQDISATLNFIVPGEVMCGFLQFHVTVYKEDAGKHIKEVDDELIINFDVTLQQTLRVRGIMIGYNGPSSLGPNAQNLTIAAPTLGDLQTTGAWTLLTYPVQSTGEFSNAGTIIWNLPLSDAYTPGGCTVNWDALIAAAQAQIVADGNLQDVLYYGLLATGIPMGWVIGCGTIGLGTGGDGDQVAMAHELGHACGLNHAPCGDPHAPDPNYPAYEPYDPAGTPEASIGEYGLNITNGNIMSPSTFKDFMSYCNPEWISLYHYGRLINNAGLNPALVCLPWCIFDSPVKEYAVTNPSDPEPPSKWDTPKDLGQAIKSVISVIGLEHANGKIEIMSVMRVETTPSIRRGKESGMMAELLGARGRVLAAAPIYRLPLKTSCNMGEIPAKCSYPYLLQAFIPDVKRGLALCIRRGSTQVWKRRAPKVKPRITEFKLSLNKKNRLVVEWKLEISNNKQECWLQWSVDRNRWNALATMLRGERAVFDATNLPSGRVWIRLLVGDGFHTVKAKPLSVEVPLYRPVVSILAPRDGERLMAGRNMRLWGVVSDGSGKALATKKTTWLLDGERVADTLDQFVEVPTMGKHELTLAVVTKGGETRRTVHFISLPARKEPSQKR